MLDEKYPEWKQSHTEPLRQSFKYNFESETEKIQAVDEKVSENF